MEDNILISLDSKRLGYGKVILENPGLISIRKGVTVIYGDNGSGKTTLGTILEKGRYAYGNRLSFAPGINSVKMLSFTDIHSLSGMEVTYYAQRMESSMNDMVPSVSGILGAKMHSELWNEYCQTLGLRDVADKKVNYLSSGELRKLLIINALLDKPDILILDNPYIGLDAGSRREFDAMMRELKVRDVAVLMLLCDTADIPDYTDSVITMDRLVILPSVTDAGEIERMRKHTPPAGCEPVVLPEPSHRNQPECDIVFAIRNGHIRYGQRDILKNFDWEVRNGERWVLTGPNGSGKSLLLSLICADNPQAYANDITLFDRKRGSGESIWEIKDTIGYVSPEMQLFFKSDANVTDIIAQGLRSWLHRYGPVTYEEKKLADEWMALLEITHLADRKFRDISAGEQRMVLVARAMIKQPAILVLDEPLHGLSPRHKERIKSVTDALMHRNGASLIYVTHYTSEIPSCITHTRTLTVSDRSACSEPVH